MADHLPVEQLLVAVALGAHQRQVGLGRRQLGTVGFQLQAHVLRVEFGQRLLGPDPLPFLHQALADLAADAEGQLRLEARAHFAGVTVGSGFGRLRLHNQGRARHGGWGSFLTAGGQHQRGSGGQNEGKGMTQHDESFREVHIEYLY